MIALRIGRCRLRSVQCLTKKASARAFSDSNNGRSGYASSR